MKSIRVSMQAWRGKRFFFKGVVALMFLLGAISGVVIEGQRVVAQSHQTPVLVDFYPSEFDGEREYNFAKPRSHMFVRGTPLLPSILSFRAVSPAPLPERELMLTFDLSTTLRTSIGNNVRTLHTLIPQQARSTTVGILVTLDTDAARLAGDDRMLGFVVDDVGGTPFRPTTIPGFWQNVVLLCSTFLVLLVVTRNAALSGFVAFCVTGATLAVVPVLLRGVLVVACVTLLVWLLVHSPRIRARVPHLAAHSSVHLSVLAAIFMLYVVAFSYYSVSNHNLFRTNGYDLGIYDQVIWLIRHGQYPYTTVMGMHTLGNHAAFLMYPLALLYTFVADVRMLLVLQSIVVATAIIPIYLIAKHHRVPLLGILIAIAYIAHPAIQNMNLFDFHMDPIAATALLFMLCSVDYKRWGMLVLCSAVVLAAKENFSLTVAFFGVWLVARREWKIGTLLVVLGACWFVFTTQFLQPALNGTSQAIHLSRFAQYGSSVPEIIATFLREPGLVANELLTSENRAYVWYLLVPFAFLPLVRLDYFILAAPALFLNMISDFEYQRSLLYHYHALVIAVAAVATLHALVWMYQRLRVRPLFLTSTVVLAGTMLYGQFIIPSRRTEVQFALAQANARFDYREYVLSLLPSQARVSVSSRFHPHVSHRLQAYVFPQPFRWTLFYNRQALPYDLVIDYVIYDQKREGVEDSPFFDLQARGLYTQVVDIDGIALLRRNAGAIPDACFGERWDAPECTIATNP